MAELRNDSTNLFKRFQVIEAQASVCRATAATAPARADQECERAAELMDGDDARAVERRVPGLPGGRVLGPCGGVRLARAARAAGETGAPGARAALELYRRSSAIWSDLAIRTVR